VRQQTRGLSLSAIRRIGFFLLGELNTEKALLCLRRNYGLFYFYPSLEQAQLGPKIKKPWRFCAKAFSV
jgi:hypothetical protein